MKMRAALSTQGAGSIRHTISWNAPPRFRQTAFLSISPLNTIYYEKN